MKRRYNLFYFIGQSFRGLWRNGLMSFASIAVLMSCLIVLGGFSLLLLNINVNLEDLGALNEIEVFVDREATEEEIQAIEARIAAMDNVQSVKRITKAEALEQVKAQSEEYAHLYEDVNETNNPLTDSFTVIYKDNEKVVTLAYELNQLPGVRKVNNRLDLAVTMANFKSGVLLVFTWFLIILFVVTIFIIFNTIKLSAVSRKDEITVMRYVGATGWFIALPFLFEGVIIGAVASMAAYFAEIYFYHYVEVMALSELQMLTIVPASELYTPILLAFLAIGVVSGVLGSGISIGKYLKA